MTLLPIGIAAIVVGVIAGLILIGLLCFMCCCRGANFNCCSFHGITTTKTKKKKKRKVIVVRRRNSTRSQPPTQRVAVRQPRPMVYTLPYIRPQRWISPGNQGLAHLNRRILAIQPAPEPAPAPEPPKPTPKPAPVPDVCRCELPTASLQKGASLQFVSSEGGHGGSSVLSRGDTCNHRQMQALPMPPPEPSPPAIFHQINHEEYHHTQQAPPPPPNMPIAFVNMSPNYQISQLDGGSMGGGTMMGGGMSGATFEINGVQPGNTMQGYHSATYSHIPCDLPQTQSVIMEPYMVDNPTANGGAVYIQENGDSNSCYHQYS
ncbi:hypothetical protein CAPTEDRAFT_209393 [Capitella teleta]|uniref:Uncharacterized protein n=1 Tax=Capitella teleta TaxID=283909 RepID=R7V423_CAPTE|nr:hypothetical protein CAPTEDRAFT_209393 [Capitella teleta]|eukprot:ELU11106.1 hypothetical protein CAPTEDRAFT_209393 [Capitella teleta]